MLDDTCASICIRYLLLKIPTSRGEAIIRGDQRQARIAYCQALKGVFSTIVIEETKQPEDNRAEPVGAIQSRALGMGKEVKVGEMSPAILQEVLQTLTKFQDTFAWTEDELEGVSREVMVHKLNIDPTIAPVVQKKKKT